MRGSCNLYIGFVLLSLIFISSCNNADKTVRDDQSKVLRPKVPIMGWASWNNYRVNINEKIIKAQADALVETGLMNAGYKYINIDDGFFGGRDENGNLLVHKTRFPNGMKNLADYIHEKGLKAGIYTDAGINTCASYWDKDTIGVGMGLYGHERSDLTLMLNDWDYDFIKVDWCGGEWLGLDDEIRYTKIGNMIREINPEVVYNICRWEFPGEWVVNTADSWRIAGDIANTFESVMHIVDQNANLWKYSGPGHVNDMDMLQVGRGMSFEEDKTHFSMWCMLNSPLIAGNDLTKMSDQTLDILTNKEMIDINQDPLVYQARRLKDEGDLEVWAKPLKSTLSGEVAVALLNRSDSSKWMSFKMEDVGIDPSKKNTIRDVWKHKELQPNQNKLSMKVPSHGVVVLKIQGESLPYNVFQFE
ncbi:glycoside hydrolase family 27 protein [Gramella jeungdoensis]|uniref:Alpha-galactosidase n=1 Tax=Gramella jeungdoensis TaxID=708091 RepID=A0ABT0Z570_9FLAO|nr:glycoside hydrolase family 27 protein [Gramella jeungdoensis]MCM8570375.1 glycoside hydrolase family 27 protein [Gramella jeungdoensis]